MHIVRQNRLLVLLLVITGAVYGLSLMNGFVDLDDQLLVTGNPHVQSLSAETIAYVFTHFDPELYIPVTFLSYQIPIAMFGLHAWHMHLLSLIIHLASVFLVWRIARQLGAQDGTALAAAALFALHPLSSEAVLWISARKDLLSGCFALASLWAFLRWKEGGGRRAYLLSVGLFALALLSKVSTILLPAAFVLLHARGRRTVWKELAPFFLLSLALGITAMAGKTLVAGTLEPWTMVLMAGRSVLLYLTLTVIPSGFAAVHAIPREAALHSPLVPLGLGITGGLMAAGWRLRKRYPLVSHGIVFFFLMLAPSFAHYTRGGTDFMLGSERYAYAASAGLFLAMADLWGRVRSSPRIGAAARRIVTALSVLIVMVLGYLTVLRTFVFADALIFNIDILQKYPADGRTHHNLAVALEQAGRPYEAEMTYRAAIALEPEFMESFIGLGSLLMREGRRDEGKDLFRGAIAVRPDSFKGYYHLGLAAEQEEDFSEALRLYRETESRFHDWPEIHLRLATVLGKLKRYEEALAEYRVLAELDPSFAERAQKAVQGLQ